MSRIASMAVLLSLAVTSGRVTAQSRQYVLHSAGESIQQRALRLEIQSGGTAKLDLSASYNEPGLLSSPAVLQLGMGTSEQSATYLLSLVVQPVPALKFASVSASYISSREVKLLPGARDELTKPGGLIEGSFGNVGPRGSCATRLSEVRYALALVRRPAAQSYINLLVVEGKPDGSELTVLSAKVIPIDESDAALGRQLGVGFDGSNLLIGERTRLRVLSYDATGGGMGSPSAPISLPPGDWQYASAGGRRDGGFVALLVRQGQAALANVRANGSEWIVDGPMVLDGLDPARERVLGAFEPGGERAVAVGQGTSSTRACALEAGATTPVCRTFPIAFQTAVYPAPVALPVGSRAAFLLGRVGGILALYRLDLDLASDAALAPISVTAVAPATPLTAIDYSETLTWQDVRPLTAQIDPSSVTLTQTQGVAGPEVRLLVSLLRALPEPATVTYAFQQTSNAVEGIDFDDLTQGAPGKTLAFAIGETQKTITLRARGRACRSTGSFRVVLSNSSANITALTGQVTVTLPAELCQGPVVEVFGSGNVCGAGFVTLRASVSGQAPITIRWSDGLEQIATATPAVLTRDVTQPGTYTVVSATNPVSGTSPAVIRGSAVVSAGTAPITLKATRGTLDLVQEGVEVVDGANEVLLEPVAQGETIVVSADGETGSFDWSLRPGVGEIVSGQGTRQLSIRTSGSGILWASARRSGCAESAAGIVRAVVFPPGMSANESAPLAGGPVRARVAYRSDEGANGFAASLPNDRGASGPFSYAFFYFPVVGTVVPEVFVKCYRKSGERIYDVFAGGLTTFEYIVVFEASGERRQSLKRQSTEGFRYATGFASMPMAPGTVAEGAGAARERLLPEAEVRSELPRILANGAAPDGRVLLELRYRSGGSEPWKRATGTADPYAKFARFDFFGESNPEFFVKVLDFGPPAPAYKVFFSALTTFEYELTLVNVETGQAVVYRKVGGDREAGAFAPLLLNPTQTERTWPQIGLVNVATGVPPSRDASKAYRVDTNATIRFALAAGSAGNSAWDFGGTPSGPDRVDLVPGQVVARTYPAPGLQLVQVSPRDGTAASAPKGAVLLDIRTPSVEPLSASIRIPSGGKVGEALTFLATDIRGGISPYAFACAVGVEVLMQSGDGSSIELKKTFSTAGDVPVSCELRDRRDIDTIAIKGSGTVRITAALPQLAARIEIPSEGRVCLAGQQCTPVEISAAVTGGRPPYRLKCLWGDGPTREIGVAHDSHPTLRHEYTDNKKRDVECTVLDSVEAETPKTFGSVFVTAGPLERPSVEVTASPIDRRTALVIHPTGDVKPYRVECRFTYLDSSSMEIVGPVVEAESGEAEGAARLDIVANWYDLTLGYSNCGAPKKYSCTVTGSGQQQNTLSFGNEITLCEVDRGGLGETRRKGAQ